MNSRSDEQTKKLIKLMNTHYFTAADVADCLINGADPLAKDKYGNTLLHKLAMRLPANLKGDDICIEQLVRTYNVSIEILNDDGKTPLQCLMTKTFSQNNVRLLLGLKANRNTKDDDGDSLQVHLIKNNSFKKFTALISELEGEGAELIIANIQSIDTSKEIKKNGVIGSGIFANVYSGDWNKTEVAIKELTIKCNSDQLTTYYNEINIMNRLSGSGYVIRLLAYDHKKLSIVMEYVAQGTLKNYIVNNIALSWNERYEITQGAIRGLKYIHDCKIIHSDIKSENILIQKNLEHWQIKIIDFGFSGFLSQRSDSDFSGTPFYMAPEIFKRHKHNLKSDVFSLGVVIGEIAIWKYIEDACLEIKSVEKLIKYHEEEKRVELPKDCPQKFALLVKWPWNKDINKRPSSAEMEKEVETDLNTISVKLMRIA